MKYDKLYIESELFELPDENMDFVEESFSVART